MNLQVSTAFSKDDVVESEQYGTGVITAVSVRFLILPNDEREEDISYFVRFAAEERIVGESELCGVLQTATDARQSTLSHN